MLADTRQPSIALLIALCLLLLPVDAVAQTGAFNPSSLDGSRASSPLGWDTVLQPGNPSLSVRNSRTVQQAPRRRSRDSLKNGIIIGAIVGAAALGTFGAVLCKAEQEPGGPSCVGDTLRVAALGSAIGAGVGLAVDAAASRHRGVTLSKTIRF